MSEISILTEHSSFSIVNFKYFEGDPRSGVNSIFSVRVVSGDFSGVGDFEYNIDMYKQFILLLVDLYDFKINNVMLKDQMHHGRNWVEFRMDRLGHLGIEGELDEPGGSQFVHFEMGVDQTYLKSFIDSMKWILLL